MQGKSVFLLSLGCSRNTVDSETMIALLETAGHTVVQQPEGADVLVVNTCSFIEDAKQEAIDTILELSKYKKSSTRLIVTGCFPQLYSQEILKQMPEVDVVMGVGSLDLILDAVEKDEVKDYPQSRATERRYKEYPGGRKLITPPWHAYLKVSEGCSGSCSFCLIPLIKGPMRSRSIEAVVEEAKRLEEMGIKELILTSQDTLAYGRDLGVKNGIKTLVNSLLDRTGIELIRLLYLNPTEELFGILDLFENKRMLPYLDIPVQHVSAKILKSMHRYGSGDYFRGLLSRIRDRYPDAVFRTTVIVGYPGEKEADFRELLDFTGDVKFNHLGVFVFSPQQETEALRLGERVKKSVAEKRRGTILELQRRVSKEKLKKEVGKVFPVLVEERTGEDGLYFGRSYHFAPEVDGVFVVQSKRKLDPGTIVRARVTWADDYDLHGSVIEDGDLNR
ncbi:MAG TPA: 30S ribosomal protein S12 methylthiotransferase RimO [Spirochaetota bacterium]|nr:30S ribosomal protein S12 methylthiotransferase RimO [Spirochaetota bacterium]